MPVRVTEEPIDRLEEHAGVPIAFVVERVLRVVGAGFGGIRLEEVPVAEPWVKDYDAIEGEGPTRWPRRFDVSSWGLLATQDAHGRTGGAVVAFDTPELWMLEGRRDRAVLWDLRVRPDVRGTGIGAALFSAVASWARGHGCRALTVETQNVNVPACRFYEAQGCRLRSIDRFAYPELPDEVQLVWSTVL